MSNQCIICYFILGYVIFFPVILLYNTLAQTQILLCFI